MIDTASNSVTSIPVGGTARDIAVSPDTPYAYVINQSGYVTAIQTATHYTVTIPLEGKSSIGDFMIIASGRSDRHVGAIADQIQTKLKEAGHARARVEGQDTCDWVLIDTGDIIVHVFRPEVREFYNLEKMWSAERPGDVTH